MFYILKLTKSSRSNLNVEGQALELVSTQETFAYVSMQVDTIVEEIIDGIVVRRYHTYMWGDIYDYWLVPIDHKGIDIRGYAPESKGRRFFVFRKVGDRIDALGDWDSSCKSQIFEASRFKDGDTTIEERTVEGRVVNSWKVFNYEWKKT